jgi:hypothetical protein
LSRQLTMVDECTSAQERSLFAFKWHHLCLSLIPAIAVKAID